MMAIVRVVVVQMKINMMIIGSVAVVKLDYHPKNTEIWHGDVLPLDMLLLSRDMGELDEVASLAERGALMYRQVGANNIIIITGILNLILIVNDNNATCCAGEQARGSGFPVGQSGQAA